MLLPLVVTAPAFLFCDGVQIDRAGCAGVVTYDPLQRYTVWTYERGVAARDEGPGVPVVSIVWQCPADTNQDGVVDGLDFGAWLGAFNAGSLLADANGDGVLSGQDYGAWLAARNAAIAGECD